MSLVSQQAIVESFQLSLASGIDNVILHKFQFSANNIVYIFLKLLSIPVWQHKACYYIVSYVISCIIL